MILAIRPGLYWQTMATEQQPGLSGALKGIAALAILVVALIGIGAVLGVIPQEALQEWFTKAGLILVIVIAAAIALGLITRSGGGKT